MPYFVQAVMEREPSGRAPYGLSSSAPNEGFPRCCRRTPSMVVKLLAHDVSTFTYKYEVEQGEREGATILESHRLLAVPSPLHRMRRFRSRR
jgi:hypothetical protein